MITPIKDTWKMRLFYVAEAIAFFTFVTVQWYLVYFVGRGACRFIHRLLY